MLDLEDTEDPVGLAAFVGGLAGVEDPEIIAHRDSTK